ncbi:MAG TPA: hypothetical protein VNP73_11530 [Actinomycetota bacterium]|nr:hypothetical protein [Actinomycetota bacterium]
MTNVTRVLGVVVLGLAAVILWRIMQNPVPVAQGPLPRATAIPFDEPFWGKVRDWEVVGPGTLEVKLRLLNTGNAVDEGECDLTAFDRNGAVASIPVSTGGPATPSYRVHVTTDIKIPDRGADDIERLEVDC